MPDADPSGRSIVGAAAFNHLVASGQTLQSVMLVRFAEHSVHFVPWVLDDIESYRVEMKESAMRVTCRAAHRLITSAIESVFKAVF